MLLARLLIRKIPLHQNVKYASSLSKWATFDHETNILKSTRHVEIPKENFVDHVCKNFWNWGTKLALTCAATGRSYTYGQINSASEVLSVNLAAVLGLRPGDVVAIVLPNIPEYAVVFYGAASAGLVLTPANPLYTQDELAKQFTDAKIKAVVTSPLSVETVQAALKNTPAGGCPIILIWFPTEPKEQVNQTIQTHSQTWLSLIPSGISGVPKGVVLTHANLVASACIANHPTAINHFPQSNLQEVTLATIPLFHIYGIVNVLGLSLGRGFNVITLPKFEPQLFANSFAKFKPSYMFFVPTLMSFVARSPLISKEDLNKLKFAGSASAPLTKQIVSELRAKSGNPDLIIKNGYGLTETSAMVTLQAESFTKECIGDPSANTEAKIVDAEGTALPLGQEGELCVRGPQIMKGYLNNPQATNAILSPDGWLRTGNAGFVDSSDGSIVLVDRIKELIKVKGFQVSPTELELILLEMDGIADVAVIGVPDASAGEVPRAFVVKKSGSTISEDSVHNFLKPKVVKYKQLKGGVVFLNEIPKSGAGKPLKKQLRTLT